MIIRRAKTSELAELQSFYNAHWGIKHALVNVKAFVDYFFVEGEHLNFVIARETEDGDILSACGYVMSNSTRNPDAWTTLWLTRKGAGSSIGLQIVDYIATKIGIRVLSTNHARQNTLISYEFLGYKTAKMEHYYRLSDKTSYDVAVIKQKQILPYETTKYALRRFANPYEMRKDFDPSWLSKCTPYKDIEYIARRYYEFPFYSYLVYGIIDNQNQCQAIVVLRKVDVNCTSVLRIVDLIGKHDDFSKIGHSIQNLMDAYECEYIDFYCYGLGEEILLTAGFTRKTEDGGNVIPNYLEPYAPISTDYYLFYNNTDDFVMFKADGDQDRLHIDLI